MSDKEPREDKSEKAEKADTKTEASATTYKYVGNGASFHGVPARDLTKDDFDALDDEQKEAVKTGGVYKKGGR